MTTDAPRPRIELVVLLASAGGLDALSEVLHGIPTEFGAAIVVQQHLGGHSSVLPTILGRFTTHRVGWAFDGEFVAPGQVIVCPPDMHMELTRDGYFHLHKMESLAERRFDVLLSSVATSFGARSVAVVLSGSGRDGAEGVTAMKRAGAIVIAQSPATADYPSMPIAAAKAGADLVLPISEIGSVLASIVEGAPLPCPSGKNEPTPAADRGRQSPKTAVGKEPMETGEVTGAQHNGQGQLSSNRTIDSAGARAEAAQLRAAELRRRRQDLAAGLGATAKSVATARRRAEESLRRAQQAQQAAERARRHPNA